MHIVDITPDVVKLTVPPGEIEVELHYKSPATWLPDLDADPPETEDDRPDDLPGIDTVCRVTKTRDGAGYVSGKAIVTHDDHTGGLHATIAITFAAATD